MVAENEAVRIERRVNDREGPGAGELRLAIPDYASLHTPPRIQARTVVCDQVLDRRIHIYR